MSVKDKFTTDEWKSLLKAPMLAAYAVAGAAPSKQDDFMREMEAVADGVVEGEQRASKDSLLGTVIADIVANAQDEQRGQTEKLSLDEVKSRALATCREVAAMLDAKVDAQEAYEYKRWVLIVAEKSRRRRKKGASSALAASRSAGARWQPSMKSARR